MKQILYTALVTPFEAQSERVDYESLERLLRAQEQAQNGVVLFGSTGEGLSLQEDEKRAILNFALKLELKTQIIVGVPSFNLKNACEFLDFCRDLPLDGYLFTTPIYTKPGILGQSAWFEKLLNKAAHKAMLYNIPSRSGVKLYPEVVKNLKQHPYFWAIKDSSASIDSLVEYQEAAPLITLFCGDDYFMPAAKALGAHGLVSVMSNAWPMLTRNFVDEVLNNKISDHQWWHAGKALGLVSNPVPIKALLKDLNIIKSDHVRLPLNIQDFTSREILLHIHNKLTTQSNYA